jgi:hypothetical protein
MLPLLHHHFTGYYPCNGPILPDIGLATDQFYYMLSFLHYHFTGYCTCNAPILLDIALTADEFY